MCVAAGVDLSMPDRKPMVCKIKKASTGELDATVKAEVIMTATGRVANTKGLGLEEAGVALNRCLPLLPPLGAAPSPRCRATHHLPHRPRPAVPPCLPACIAVRSVECVDTAGGHLGARLLGAAQGAGGQGNHHRRQEHGDQRARSLRGWRRGWPPIPRVDWHRAGMSDCSVPALSTSAAQSACVSLAPALMSPACSSCLPARRRLPVPPCVASCHQCAAW
jgi:hypothetical protein